MTDRTVTDAESKPVFGGGNSLVIGDALNLEIGNRIGQCRPGKTESAEHGYKKRFHDSSPFCCHQA